MASEVAGRGEQAVLRTRRRGWPFDCTRNQRLTLIYFNLLTKIYLRILFIRFNGLNVSDEF